MRHMLEHDIKPSDIMTREAFENAMVVIMALGGSTNAVLHLIGGVTNCLVLLRLSLLVADLRHFSPPSNGESNRRSSQHR